MFFRLGNVSQIQHLTLCLHFSTLTWKMSYNILDPPLPLRAGGGQEFYRKITSLKEIID